MNSQFRILTMATISVLLLSVLLIGMRPKTAETVFAPGNMIRLHVVANSDSGTDQELKRRVRDEVILAVAPDFSGVENIELARENIRANLNRIREIASREIEKEGKFYPVRVELDTFAFPTKHYGPFVLPAGDYESVRVVIGDGGGANWWCVLFPPLCFVDMSKEAAPTAPENTGLTACLPGQDTSQAQGQPLDATTLTAAGSNNMESVTAAAGYSLSTVEYRFRILDLLSQK